MAYTFIKFCQKHTFPVKNNFQSGCPMGEEAFGQWRRIRDVLYDGKYPNSFLTSTFIRTKLPSLRFFMCMGRFYMGVQSGRRSKRRKKQYG